MRRMRIGPNLSPGVRTLIIINVVVFALQILFSKQGFIEYLFALWPEGVASQMFIWQLFTYQFLHGGFMHIFFNMFALWMFGSELENIWGKKEFYKYYLICGFGAGLLIFFGEYFLSGRNYPTLGASGAVLGILLAYAVHWPDRYLVIWFLFPMKTKYVVLIFGVFSLVASVNPGSASTISHIGHLGGIVTGLLYFMLVKKINVFQKLGGSPMSASEIKQKYNQFKRKFPSKNHKIDLKDPKNEQKVNQLLDKISENGIHSLTEEERSFLTQFAQKKRDEDADN